MVQLTKRVRNLTPKKFYRKCSRTDLIKARQKWKPDGDKGDDDSDADLNKTLLNFFRCSCGKIGILPYRLRHIGLEDAAPIYVQT